MGAAPPGAPFKLGGASSDTQPGNAFGPVGSGPAQHAGQAATDGSGQASPVFDMLKDGQDGKDAKNQVPG